MASEEIYNNGRYSVVVFRGRAPGGPVVLFDAWRAHPSTETFAFGEALLQKIDISHVCIKTTANDWYQGPVEGALAAAARALGGVPVTAYGASMGAYAGFNFSTALNITRVVGFVPQFSIDPRKVPFETRWSEEAALLDFHADHIDKARRVEAVLAIDPCHADDMAHVRLIARHHDVALLRVPFSGHRTASVMRECGALKKVVDIVLGREGAMGSAVRAYRRRRGATAKYWLERSRALYAHAQPRQALEAAQRAVALAEPGDYPAHENLSRAHCRLDDIDEAIRALQKSRPEPELAAQFDEWLSRLLAARGKAQFAALMASQLAGQEGGPQPRRADALRRQAAPGSV